MCSCRLAINPIPSHRYHGHDGPTLMPCYLLRLLNFINEVQFRYYVLFQNLNDWSGYIILKYILNISVIVFINF